MTWKQPIPSDLRIVFGQDNTARLIYQELLIYATNKDRVINLNGWVINLKRGQSYFTIQDFADFLNRNPKTVDSALKRLTKIYNRVDTHRTAKGCIATIRNYEEIVKMDNKMDNKTENRGITEGYQKDTNKSDKSVKKEKNFSSS